MSASMINVGLVQQNCYLERDRSLADSIVGIKEAASRGAKLILLQELHAGPYFCQTEDHQMFGSAESIPGPSTEVLSQLARELKVVIVASLFERRAPGVYHNTAVVLEQDGRIAGIYRKMHIPDDPGFYEKFYFTPGDIGFKPIETSVGKLGILICWDQWYPEAARLMALAGAEILLYPTAIGWGTQDSDKKVRESQLQAWTTIQRSHAIANGIPVMVANRVGFEANPKEKDIGIEFWGNSFIAGPQGEILALAATSKSEVLVTTLDKKHIDTVRCHWPFLRDRRIDAYHGLLARYIDGKE